ncbi:MAG: hypothetical protein WD691_08145 [Acidimicrobiales bacterium]
MTDHTKPTTKTKRAEQIEANAKHEADRPPTQQEEKAAPTEVDDDTREAYKGMIERGADAKGEGRIP